VCEWGTDPDPACNTTSRCTTQGWVVYPPTSAGASRPCPTPAAAGACPATYGAVPAGNDCTSPNLACAYPEGRCECATPTGGPPRAGGGAIWSCDKPATGCPQPRPALGSSCSAASALVCDYGACTLPAGVVETCQDGVWVDTIKACPL
jgi:hypothetical protein